MDLLSHLELFGDAMDDYHDLLVAEAAGVGDYQYLQEGAGQRLPEKPRKNVIRIESAIDALRNDTPVQARTLLRAVYGSWRDHIGLHDKYIDTNQMTVAHVLAHFGGHLTEENFALPHDDVVRTILGSMAQVPSPLAGEGQGEGIDPDAFSLGVALCKALTAVDTLIA